MRTKIILVLIILISAVLRIYQLDQVPPALFGDEIDVGYQAYSILKTSKDLNGRSLPTYLKSLAEYRAPLYIYSSVPFIHLFGLNEWGVRLPAMFWGMVSILGTFLLVKLLLGQNIALISTFLLSVSPWHLQYSRGSFEVTMLLACYLFAVYFFILGKEKGFLLIFSAILFGLTFYIYSTAVVFTPFLILLLILSYFKDLRSEKKSLFLFFIIMILTSLPMFWSIYKGEARGRFNIISIFQESVLLDKINLSRKGQKYTTPTGEVKTLDPSTEILFHNKLTVFTQVFTLNYLRSFSFDFLFGKGDPNLRHSIGEMGLLYFFELPLLLLGVWFLLTKTNFSQKGLVFGWLLLSPIPASLTYDGGFHATRLSLMLPPLVMITSAGAWYLISKRSLYFRAFSLLLIISVIVGIIFYLHRYYFHYPIESWRFWHLGYKQAFKIVNENQQAFDKVVINNSYEPSLERYLFYNQYQPDLFHRQFKGDKPISNILEGIDGFGLGDKLYFGQVNEDAKRKGGLEYVIKAKMLYLASARDEAEGDLRTYSHKNFEIIETILDPLGNPIFYILKGK